MQECAVALPVDVNTLESRENMIALADIKKF